MQPQQLVLLVQLILFVVGFTVIFLVLGSFYLIARGDYQLQQRDLAEAKRAPWWVLLPIRGLRLGVLLLLLVRLYLTVLSGQTTPAGQSAWPWELRAGLFFLLIVGWVSLNLPAQKCSWMKKLHLSPQRPLHLVAFFLLSFGSIACLTSQATAVRAPFPTAILVGILLSSALVLALIVWLGVYGYSKRGGWAAMAKRLHLHSSPSLLGLLYGAGAGVVGFLLPLALHSAFPDVPTVHLFTLVARQEGAGLAWIGATVAMLLYGVVHEILFRGLLQPRVGWIWASLAALPMMQSIVFGGGILALVLALPWVVASAWLAKRYGPWASVAMAIAFWLTVGIAGL